MKYFLVLTISFFLSCSVFAQQAKSVVNGKLLGADGKPMVTAHLHLFSNNPDTPAKRILSEQVDADGKYSLTLPAHGLYKLQYTGVNHYPANVALLCEKAETVGVNVNLKAYQYVDSYDNLFVMGNFNGYSLDDDIQPFVLQPDGIYIATFDAGEIEDIEYQVIGLEASGLPVNGTQNEGYRCDDIGGYRSLIRTQGGETKVWFEPKKLFRNSAEGSVKFRNQKSLAAQYYALDKNLSERRKRYASQYPAFTAGRKLPPGSRYDWSADFTAVQKAMKDESNQTLKDAYLLASLEFGGLEKDTSLGRKALSEIPATSPLWIEVPFLMPRIISALSAPRQYIPYLTQAMEGIADTAVQPIFLASVLYATQSPFDTTTFNQTYTKVLSNNSDQSILNLRLKRLKDQPALEVGKPLPGLSIKLKDDAETLLTDNTLLGKVCLIEFWSTRNTVAVEKIPMITQIYDRYKDKGFTVLSYSVDPSWDDVLKFRTGDRTMPWMHAYFYDNESGGYALPAEIREVPFEIMIGRDGKILAFGQDLKADELMELVAKILGK